MAPTRRKLIARKMSVTSVQQDWFGRFLDYIKDECLLAENTLQAYRRDLVGFYQWLGPRPIKELRIQDLSEYLGWLNGQGLSPSSVARRVVSMRVFFRFLQLEGHLEGNEAELLGSPKLWERIPGVLTPGQIDQLMVAPVEGTDVYWLRDRAILELFYATGGRVSEVATLRLRDVHLQEGYCRFTGKGDKQRDVPLGRQAIKVFNAWLSQGRPELERYIERRSRRRGGVESPETLPDWAFLSRTGHELRREALWELIKKYASRIGASETISPHSMRHSFATHLMASGADIRQVQVLLGHSNIRTTEIYTHVDPSELKKVHHKYHPRS
ncbi:MAG: tyrosine recombinase [Planctomycetia bacterium]|nr:tyrosine recombinase [Planctomycetia bacterium]